METSPYRLATPPPSRGLACPRCPAKSELLFRHVAEVEVDECPTCRGQWLDREVFSNLVMEPARQREVMERARMAQLHVVDTDGLDCPSCGQEMTRKNFSRSSGIHIDVCARHGVWLDDGELRDIADYLRRDEDNLTLAPRTAPGESPSATLGLAEPDLAFPPLDSPPPPLPYSKPRPAAGDDPAETSDIVGTAILFIGYIALRLALGF